MKLKLLTLKKNFLIIIIVLFCLGIFNIYFNLSNLKDKNLKDNGITGSLIIFEDLDQNYYYPEKTLREITDRTFITINRLIEKRENLISLKNCSFSKKTDLVTKIIINTEKNLNHVIVNYEIKPVKNVINCKNSIVELFKNTLKNEVILNQIIKIKNQLTNYQNELTNYQNTLTQVNLNDYKINSMSSYEKTQITSKINELATLIDFSQRLLNILDDEDRMISEIILKEKEKEKNIDLKFLLNALIIMLFIFFYLLIILIINKKILKFK
jgi:hypothetical protein